MHMTKNYLLIIILLAISLSHAGLNYPYTGQELNYIHVLFEWDQEPDAVGYNLQISNTEYFRNVILNINEETALYIEKDTLAWENTYYWRVRPIYGDNSYGEWSEISYFIIGEPLSSGQDVEIYNNDLIQDGVIVYGGGTGAIDRFGNEIWNTQNIYMNYIDSYGQLYGMMVWEQGCKLNFYNQYLWMSPEYIEVDYHEIKQIPNGNYMAFVPTYQLGPIPLGDWTQNFQDLGYVADGVTNEFQWEGCKIIEWDEETGEEVWS